MNTPKKILMIDDDAAFIDSTRDLLEAYGYRVDAAYEGESGLKLARSFKPDLIILDVMMATDTQGFDVARRIPEQPELKDTRVILVTGVVKALHFKDKLEPDATWLPVDRILDKPIDPDRLMREVEKILKSGA